jgi:hypothetical protein
MCNTFCNAYPFHCSPLQNGTVLKMKSDNRKVLKKRAESDRFVTYNALHAQFCVQPIGAAPFLRFLIHGD